MNDSQERANDNAKITDNNKDKENAHSSDNDNKSAHGLDEADEAATVGAEDAAKDAVAYLVVAAAQIALEMAEEVGDPEPKQQLMVVAGDRIMIIFHDKKVLSFFPDGRDDQFKLLSTINVTRNNLVELEGTTRHTGSPTTITRIAPATKATGPSMNIAGWLE